MGHDDKVVLFLAFAVYTLHVDLSPTVTDSV